MVMIEESGMCFGKFPDEDVFHIEKCDVYEKRLKPIGFKTCEFILKRNQALYFVEAKATSPRQMKANTPQEKSEKYHEYIQDIVHKMRDSFALFASLALNRHKDDHLPQNMAGQDLSSMEMNCILVVKNAETAWLVDLRDKLNSEIKKERRTWEINRFFVLNEAQARSKQFVV